MADSVLMRAFPASLERTGPRQLTGRLVPYGSPTDVMDMVDGKPDIYREGFMPGAFSRQAASREKGVLRRIGLIHKHEGGLGFLGPFTALREESDGLYGDAEVLRSKAGDVEDLLSAGVDELSVEFRLPGRSHTTVDADGIRWRNHAHLDAVALEPKGAYTGAQVMAFRAELDALAAEQAQAQEQVSEEEAEVIRAAEAAQRAQAEAAERRARWDALSARYDIERERQQLFVREYGLTVPPPYPVHGY